MSLFQPLSYLIKKEKKKKEKNFNKIEFGGTFIEIYLSCQPKRKREKGRERRGKKKKKKKKECGTRLTGVQKKAVPFGRNVPCFSWPRY